MLILNKLSDFFDKYVAGAVGMALLFATLVLCVNVVGRYCFGRSIIFAEELATYTVIWLTLVGSGVCVKRGIHVSVDAFTNLLPTRGKKFFAVFCNTIGLLYSICLLWIGIKLSLQVGGSGQISPAMRAPMLCVYAAIPVGAFYMSLEYLKKMVEMFIYGIKLEDDDSYDPKNSIA